MRLGIMQPYFLPYVGYFQLIGACGEFVLHDDLKFTKKGWINRNRIESNGSERVFSLPLKKASDYCEIRERELADDFDPKDLMRTFEGAYRSAPYWSETASILEDILACSERNLFNFVRHSIEVVSNNLGLQVPFIASSLLSLDKESRGEDRVLDICKALSATDYLNPIGGVNLYDSSRFLERGVGLAFIQSNLTHYERGGNGFVPALSVVDQLAYSGLDRLGEVIANDFKILSSTS
jgi:hypothetical protein